MPLRMIILENRLPADIKEYILKKLESDFLCPYGLASESVHSPFYTKNGYWRGPAWGPDQIIFTLALRNMGETELSEKISSGYKKAIEKSGFSENHDPLTGESLKCKAYCWTANAYRLLH
jgi:glycogen debranching enzyme